MQKDILENFEKLSEWTLSNFRKLGETNLEIGQRLLEEQIALTGALLSTASRGVNEAGSVKDYRDFAAQQTTCAGMLAESDGERPHLRRDHHGSGTGLYPDLRQEPPRRAG